MQQKLQKCQLIAFVICSRDNPGTWVLSMALRLFPTIQNTSHKELIHGGCRLPQLSQAALLIAAGITTYSDDDIAVIH